MLSESLSDIRAALGVLTTPTKLAILGAAGLCAVLLVLGVGAGVSAWKQSRFDAKQAAAAEERQALAVERDAALRRAEAAEAQVPLLRQDIRDRDVLIDKSSAKIQQADDARAAAVEEYETEQATLGLPVDAAERRRRACAKLAALGFPCE